MIKINLQNTIIKTLCPIGPNVNLCENISVWARIDEILEMVLSTRFQFTSMGYIALFAFICHYFGFTIGSKLAWWTCYSPHVAHGLATGLLSQFHGTFSTVLQAQWYSLIPQQFDLPPSAIHCHFPRCNRWTQGMEPQLPGFHGGSQRLLWVSWTYKETRHLLVTIKSPVSTSAVKHWWNPLKEFGGLGTLTTWLRRWWRVVWEVTPGPWLCCALL